MIPAALFPAYIMRIKRANGRENMEPIRDTAEALLPFEPDLNQAYEVLEAAHPDRFKTVEAEQAYAKAEAAMKAKFTADHPGFAEAMANMQAAHLRYGDAEREIEADFISHGGTKPEFHELRQLVIDGYFSGPDVTVERLYPPDPPTP